MVASSFFQLDFQNNQTIRARERSTKRRITADPNIPFEPAIRILMSCSSS